MTNNQKTPISKKRKFDQMNTDHIETQSSVLLAECINDIEMNYAIYNH